jgi:5'-nucleotidase
LLNRKKEITRSENKAGESALGNLIADAQRWKMKTNFAFMNPGGIRANIPAGKVTWGDLYTIQPFNNDLLKMELTGKQIDRLLQQQFQHPSKRQILKVSGLTFTWSNDRIIQIKQSDGTPLPRRIFRDGCDPRGSKSMPCLKRGYHTERKKFSQE